jgi:hypothetical protein
MRYFKMVGLCLAAVFVMSAVVVASASAEGALFLFPNAANGSAQDFSSKTGAGKLVQKSGAEVKCTSATNTGVAIAHSDRAEKVLIVFQGCSETLLGVTKECNTPTQPAGVIKTNELKGNLGLLNKTGEAEKVGLVLKAEEATGLFAEFECGAAFKIKVRGREISSERAGIIAEVLPGSVEVLIDKGEAGLLTYKKEEGTGTNPWEQRWRSLTTLGALVDELLLESSIDGGAFELSAIEEAENVKIFFLESVRILS